MSEPFQFILKKVDHGARLGTIKTAHGSIQTPAFMPVGTSATVKAMLMSHVRDTGADIVLSNTYHLMLRPTADRIETLGGLQKFMNWNGPILTDSGGFQVMSLAKLCKLTEKGVTFRSHIDGKSYSLTPEYSTQLQHKLNATISMAFDECTPYPCSYEYAQQSMERSMRWAKRSRESFQTRTGYAQFGIIQGSIYEDLREKSSRDLIDMNFDGYAIGGLAVGEGQTQMLHILNVTVPLLPCQKARYLMGVGTPEDLIKAVACGIDMFDCVIPTRSGRTALAYTNQGKINIRNAQYKDDASSLSHTCNCHTCSYYSKAYLHHLIKSKEILGSMLLTWHNLHYYQMIMKNIRKSIENDQFLIFYERFFNTLGDSSKNNHL